MKGKRTALSLIFSCVVIVFSCLAGIAGAFIGNRLITSNTPIGQALQQTMSSDNIKVVNEDSAIIDVVNKASPSVVSIIISKDLPLYENDTGDLSPYFNDPFSRGFDNTVPQQNQNSQNQTQLQEVGEGSGFIISADGMIVTNRHVVEDDQASYTVIFNDGKKYDAKVLAKDTLLDIAFIKIDATGLTPLTFGSSSGLKVGQRVIAIGNALGQFSNTVSTGIISGLKRNVTAGDTLGSQTEQLTNVIQTDASINFGNSGGPLLDLDGNVIGINVAIAQNAQNIGFAIPSDVVVDLQKRLNANGKIERPILGVRYQLIDSNLQSKDKLSVDYGALVVKGQNADQPAIVPGSPAEKAGLKEGDIILDVDGQKINADNPLQVLIQQHNFNDVVTLTILRNGNQSDLKVTLIQFQQ